MTTNDWLDHAEYPFASRYVELEMGRMHYVDEGEGEVLLMVHGNPSWSFVYRHFIKGLSGKFRCIAVDLIGFGLSDKPLDWSYLPEDHAKTLGAFIDKLGLSSFTLFVQDWGGPIGLANAIEHPQRLKRIVLMNTWMWSVNGDPHYERFSGFMGGMIGRWLIRRFNFFANVVMKKAMGDPAKLPPPVHRHYLMPLQQRDERKGCWTFPRQIIGSSDWLATLWENRAALADKPTLILWGMKDIAFREKELERWIGLFTHHEVHRLEQAGHYVQEEMGRELCPVVETFLLQGERA